MTTSKFCSNMSLLLTGRLWPKNIKISQEEDIMSSSWKTKMYVTVTHVKRQGGRLFVSPHWTTLTGTGLVVLL